MAIVSFDHVRKVYPDGTVAVQDFTLDIADGELMVLVGPSGCGKTTALRMVAGLEEISAGEVRIGDEVVNGLPPRDRDVAMVFQNYALYPHKSIYENLAFPLRLRKLSKSDDRRASPADGAGPRARGAAAAEAASALGRTAPAGRDGARDDPRAAGVLDGRAAVEPRREAAHADARRDRPPAQGGQRHDDLRHPRSGRGDDARPARRRYAQGRAAAGRRPAGAVHAAGEPLRRGLHRQPRDELLRRPRRALGRRPPPSPSATASG